MPILLGCHLPATSSRSAQTTDDFKFNRTRNP